MITLFEGDNRVSLRRLITEGVRVHSIVTDPPYGLTSITKRFGKEGSAPARTEKNDGSFSRLSKGFMSMAWDGTGIERDPEFWRLIWEILLPGGYCFAFSGSRTGHWQAVAMEQAGFIMHPMHGWTFGSGFPKAHSAKAAGPEWDGWAYGTQTQKPALENIYLGQKPFTLAEVFLTSVLDGLLKLLEHHSCRSKVRGAELLRSVSIAELITTLSNHNLIEASIAQSLAHLLQGAAIEAQTGAAEDISVRMDMLLSELVMNMSSNTVRSWLTCLVVLWSLGNTFTTAIASETTIDLKTWNFLAGQIISDCTTPLSEPIGHGSNVLTAGRCLTRVSASLLSRLSTFATANAIAQLVPSGNGLGADSRPRLEPIYLGQKPFSEKTGILNIQKHGVGAVNIDGCRVPTGDNLNGGAYAQDPTQRETMWGAEAGNSWKRGGAGEYQQPSGRYPANLLHDGSPEVLAMFPDSKGQQGAVTGDEPSGVTKEIYGKFNGRVPAPVRGDSGSAARFFNNFPLTDLDYQLAIEAGLIGEDQGDPLFYNAKAGKLDRAGSDHPTVKPVALMRHLIRHITPPGGIVLDPFAGSGTTGVAANLEGFDCILMEAELNYVKFLRQRFEIEDDCDLLADTISQETGHEMAKDPLEELLG